MTAVRWILLAVLAIAAGAALFLQREAGANLRSELAILREQQRDMAQLRTERDRLRAAQPPAAEFERLRADRNALTQLRSEIDAMKARAAEAERAGSAAAANRTPPTLAFALAGDGSLSSEGSPVDIGAVRLRLMRFSRGSAVDIRLRLDERSRVDDVKATVDKLIAVEKELGLKLNLRFEQRTPQSQ